MVEPDAPVLSRGRIAAFVVLLAAVVTWDALAPHLDPVGLWWTVAIIAVGVLPATLGLIYIALPLWSNRRVLAIGLVVLVIAAGLGPPDILFFALFLATTVRWQLRPGWTWLAMTGMYSLTLVLANATDVSGLPALPFLSVGFLLANCDLLWRRFRPRRA